MIDPKSCLLDTLQTSREGKNRKQKNSYKHNPYNFNGKKIRTRYLKKDVLKTENGQKVLFIKVKIPKKTFETTQTI